jgi:hypothetical protein
MLRQHHRKRVQEANEDFEELLHLTERIARAALRVSRAALAYSFRACWL